MRAAVNFVAHTCAALALLTAFPVHRAAAQDGGRLAGSGQDGGDRWVPSLAIIGGVTVQDWSGAVESEICRGCPIPDPLAREEPLRDPATGSDLDVTPYIGGNLELMTPELPIPSSPRLFVGGEVAAAVGVSRILAQEGEPGTIESPLPEAGSGNRGFSEDTALGQGSETVAQLGNVIYGANAGVAFPFELYGRALRLKTSFAWIRYEIDVEGLVVDAECQPVPPGRTECNDNLPNGFLREIRLQGSGSGTFDGIGPGLDIEMDIGRFGPLGTSLFAGARFYYILGEREIAFGDSQPYDDQLGTDQTRARWSFEADPWIYRLGLGLRFQWLGSGE